MNKKILDINKILINKRIIFLIGEITDELSNNIIIQILYLCNINNNKTIYIYINSPGGSITAGLAIYDIIKIIKPKITIIGYGIVASMAAIILSSGNKNKRLVMKNTRIMIHQPIGKCYGSASDIKIQTKEILYLKKKINLILAKNTKKTLKQIKKDTARDYYMSAKKAIKYNIIDKIIK